MTGSSPSMTDKYTRYHRAKCRVVRCGGEVGFALTDQVEIFDELGVMKGLIGIDPFPASGMCTRCHQGHLLAKDLQVMLEPPDGA